MVFQAGVSTPDVPRCFKVARNIGVHRDRHRDETSPLRDVFLAPRPGGRNSGGIHTQGSRLEMTRTGRAKYGYRHLPFGLQMPEQQSVPVEHGSFRAPQSPPAHVPSKSTFTPLDAAKQALM